MDGFRELVCYVKGFKTINEALLFENQCIRYFKHPEIYSEWRKRKCIGMDQIFKNLTIMSIVLLLYKGDGNSLKLFWEKRSIYMNCIVIPRSIREEYLFDDKEELYGL